MDAKFLSNARRLDQCTFVLCAVNGAICSLGYLVLQCVELSRVSLIEHGSRGSHRGFKSLMSGLLNRATSFSAPHGVADVCPYATCSLFALCPCTVSAFAKELQLLT